ncbi:hypothetical protein K502DRAFT_366269 [Neoconidiobolus thromboides FSU 785]|nr:hypothetical protein K502DRAFT_366269 [Neoconidiobolus thromboides FSU 785]
MTQSTERLPPELFEMVVKCFDKVEDKDILINIAMTNKRNYHCILPYIYETLRLCYISRLEILLGSLINSRNNMNFTRLEMIKCLDLSFLSLISYELLEVTFNVLGPYLEKLIASNVVHLYDNLLLNLISHKKLKSLTLNNNYNLTDYSFELLSESLSETLVELNVQHLSRVSPLILCKLLKNLPKLKALSLCSFRNYTSSSLLKIMKRINSTLQSLKIDQIDFELDTIEPIFGQLYENITTLELGLWFDFDISDLINLFSRKNATPNITSLTLHLNRISDDITDLYKELKPLKELLPKLKYLGIKGIQTRLLELHRFIEEWKDLKYLLFCPSIQLSSKIENSFRKKATFKLIVYK